jgi:8-oxo-dGTP pyrophosphatase MutT (NUDIX family)
VAVHDGNGWVECRCGHRHWGRHGAAGLLLIRPAAGARLEVLLQLRAAWTHHGGSWALPGGARDSHEDPVSAALREAHEETGVDPARLCVLGEHPGVDHQDWSYTYVLALATDGEQTLIGNTESDELRWLVPDEVGLLPLLPAFAAAWPGLHRRLATIPSPHG